MKNSIIIPYHSNINALNACYSSLKATVDEQTEIIIVANNSNIKELDLDESLFCCRILKFNENLYYPKAINIGAENATGSILIFADADTFYPNKNWINALTEPLIKESDIGYTSSKLLNPYNGRVIDFSIACTVYNFPHPYKNRKADHPLVKNNKLSFAACAASSAIKKELFLDCGGFDESLIHSYSDIDLCIKLRNRGLQTMCVSDSIVYHKGSSTIDSGMSSNLKEDTKGVFYKKNYSYIISDMDKYIEESSNYALRNLKINKRYICLNLSTIANSEDYIKKYAEALNVQLIYTYKKPYSKRDCEHIDLFQWLDYNIQALKLPILYFVDNYLSLKNNTLWMLYRNCDNDIVIDRNFNINNLS